VAQRPIDAGERDGLTTEERGELRRLRREARVLRGERDLLIHALARHDLLDVGGKHRLARLAVATERCAFGQRRRTMRVRAMTATQSPMPPTRNTIARRIAASRAGGPFRAASARLRPSAKVARRSEPPGFPGGFPENPGRFTAKIFQVSMEAL
jgi:hypothetical protein